MAKKTGAPEKPTKKPVKESAPATFSLCVPSTIISSCNARNLEQVTNVAYQVAKAASTFQVGEIVVIDIPPKRTEAVAAAVRLEGNTGNTKVKFGPDESDPVAQSAAKQSALRDSEDLDSNGLLFATLLQYFVAPPYLTKALFRQSKYNKKFKYAEKLPKLSNLPFMNNNRVGDHFREGLTTPKHTPKVQKRGKKTSVTKLKVTKYVNIGEETPLELEGKEVPVNIRVTVDLKNKKIVSPKVAYGYSGSKSTFGYYVRLAKLITAIFTELSFPQGYSDSIFINANDYFTNGPETSLAAASTVTRGNVLLVVGKLDDFLRSFSRETIEGVSDLTDMFDSELKIPAGMRVEDAVMVALAKLQ